jgi:membrane protein implicated in regulation of membrane protease activity
VRAASLVRFVFFSFIVLSVRLLFFFFLPGHFAAVSMLRKVVQREKEEKSNGKAERGTSVFLQ